MKTICNVTIRKYDLYEKCDWTTFKVHFIPAVKPETGRNKEHIFEVTFLALTVLFDLQHKYMVFGKKNEEDNGELANSSTNTHIHYNDLTVVAKCASCFMWICFPFSLIF